MRTRLIFAAALAAALAFTATGQAQKPPKPGATTLRASAALITYSAPVTLTGKVKGAKAGVVVTLERRTAGPTTTFAPAGTATTDANGDFTFTQRPAQSSVFRAIAATTPPSPSRDEPVAVKPLVGLKVSDATPRKGQRVRFRGTVRPQHDGMRVAIQRKRADGTWATVRSPLLRDAGSAYSTYSKRFRVRRTGTYRTVIAAHVDHAEGVSRERTLTVR